MNKNQTFTAWLWIKVFTWIKLSQVYFGWNHLVNLNQNLFNPFATGDAYMPTLFQCLQWYAGSERVKEVETEHKMILAVEITWRIWIEIDFKKLKLN